MHDTSKPNEYGDGHDAPMTLLAVNQSYWLYEGVELLNDMLFGRGAYPFKVRCLIFNDGFEVNRFVGTAASAASLWRVNPDVVDRLRAENLLIEIRSSEI